MAFKTRFGKLGTFVRAKESSINMDNDNPGYDVAEVGFVTYHDNDKYMITSVCFGGRSDHLAHASRTLLTTATELSSTTSPFGNDGEVLCEDPEVAKKREELVSTPPVVKPLATVAE